MIPPPCLKDILTQIFTEQYRHWKISRASLPSVTKEGDPLRALLSLVRLLMIPIRHEGKEGEKSRSSHRVVFKKSIHPGGTPHDDYEVDNVDYI